MVHLINPSLNQLIYPITFKYRLPHPTPRIRRVDSNMNISCQGLYFLLYFLLLPTPRENRLLESPHSGEVEFLGKDKSISLQVVCFPKSSRPSEKYINTFYSEILQLKKRCLPPPLASDKPISTKTKQQVWREFPSVWIKRKDKSFGKCSFRFLETEIIPYINQVGAIVQKNPIFLNCMLNNTNIKTVCIWIYFYIEQICFIFGFS